MPALPREIVAWMPLLALCAGFQIALLLFARQRDAARWGIRFAAALVAGAAFARLGGALLHPDGRGGASILFFPLGVLAAGVGLPGRERPGFRAAAFGSLPLAWAVARSGCLVAGCCHGVATTRPWLAWTAVHPTPVYEMAGLVALQLLVGRLPAGWIPAGVLIGFGAIRLAVEPLRAAPPLGAPLVPPALLAWLWIATGLRLAASEP